MYMKSLIFSIAFLFVAAFGASAQQSGTESNDSTAVVSDTVKERKQTFRASENTARFAISTNIVDLGWFLTPNLDIQYSFGRRWSVEAMTKYNNWTFREEDPMRKNRQCSQEYSAGVRFWPWYVYSGWWFSAGGQYEEYSQRSLTNIYRKEEGDAFGLALAAGHSIQLRSWLNIDFGLGFWSGYKLYKAYEGTEACPDCGKRVDRLDGSEEPSGKFFLLPDEVFVSVMFIF